VIKRVTTQLSYTTNVTLITDGM